MSVVCCRSRATLYRLRFQMITKRRRSSAAEIAAQAETSAAHFTRELTTPTGVYRDVFEQSLLLDHDSRKPWNFLASLSAELVVISLVLLIPLLYRDHLPAVHWKDVTVGPAPLQPPVGPQLAKSPGSTSITLSSAPRRSFVFDPTASVQSPQPSSIDFAPEAPPSLGPGIGGSTSALGTFIPNFVAAPPPA